MNICLDYDGVIADTFDNLLNICKKSQESVRAGRPPSESDFRQTENLTFDHIASQLEIPNQLVREFAKQVFSRLGAEADTVFPGIAGVLKQLAAKHTLCVVTANTAAKVTATLKDADIYDCFAELFGGEERLAKSDQIIRASQATGISLSETIMIGDTFGDIRMAKAAGVRSIAVTWGYQKRDFLAEAEPDHFATAPPDLLTLADHLKTLQT